MKYENVNGYSKDIILWNILKNSKKKKKVTNFLTNF